MTPDETVFNAQTGTFEPCFECLEIIFDTAYQGKFRDENTALDDPDLQDAFGNGAVAVPEWEDELVFDPHELYE
jgi:hypothetical protein